MNLSGIFFASILLIGLCTRCQGIFGTKSLQDYIDSFIDAAKFKLDGVINLNDSSINQIWSFFKNTYRRSYSSIDEEQQRLRIFRDHLRFILESNFAKLRTYRLELNEFADWTTDEFNILKKGLAVVPSLSRRELVVQSPGKVKHDLKRVHRERFRLKRLKRNSKRRLNHHKRFFRNSFSKFFGNKNITSQQSNVFDWRTKNVISHVKNQRKCGCCYAFATATIMETLYALKTQSNNVIDFSAQQITDCSSDGNNGCSGGQFEPSILYLLKNGGKIATEASYPYKGSRHTCQTGNINEIQLGNIEYKSIPEGDEKKLAEALTTYGPIFIGVDTDSKRFMFYKSGVLTIENCPTRRQDMDHAMVVVGYGHDDGLNMPYWIVKNSWGTKWGEQGYLRLAKDLGNMCGVASMAYYGKLT